MKETDFISIILRKKAKEYAKFLYQEGYDDPMYQPEITQTIKDFETGFKAGIDFISKSIKNKE